MAGWRSIAKLLAVMLGHSHTQQGINLMQVCGVVDGKRIVADFKETKALASIRHALINDKGDLVIEFFPPTPDELRAAWAEGKRHLKETELKLGLIGNADSGCVETVDDAGRPLFDITISKKPLITAES
jgi:hypothetical protein